MKKKANIFKGYIIQNEVTLSAWRGFCLWVKLKTKLTLLMRWRRNEWAGLDRLSCLTRFLSGGGIKYVVCELDVIIFLAAIACDMPQRHKTMNRGGTARAVGCEWCLFEVRSHTTCTRYVDHVMSLSWHLTHLHGFYCRQSIFPVHKRKPTKGIWSLKTCVGMGTIGMSFRRSMLNWLSR